MLQAHFLSPILQIEEAELPCKSEIRRDGSLLERSGLHCGKSNFVIYARDKSQVYGRASKLSDEEHRHARVEGL